jgi:ankyrin repeat protein
MAVLLIRHGANVNSANRDGSTPLMAAVARGSDVIVTALLDAGAQVTAKDKTGQTALDIAIAGKKFSTARILEEVGRKK